MHPGEGIDEGDTRHRRPAVGVGPPASHAWLWEPFCTTAFRPAAEGANPQHLILGWPIWISLHFPDDLSQIQRTLLRVLGIDKARHGVGFCATRRVDFGLSSCTKIMHSATLSQQFPVACGEFKAMCLVAIGFLYTISALAPGTGVAVAICRRHGAIVRRRPASCGVQ